MKNVFFYIANKNPEGSIKLLKSLGYPNPKATSDKQLKFKLAGFLADYYKKNKDNVEALVNIANIHPDTPMIEKALIIIKERQKTEKEAQEQNKAKEQNSQPVEKQPQPQTTTQADGQWSNCTACPMVLAADSKAQPASKLSSQNINLIIALSSVVLLFGIGTTIYFSNK
jgi:hypothetical protein